MKHWAICGTRNAGKYLEIGRNILEEGGSAVDAVEAVIKEVEDNPLDWSVGYNGFPNLLGEVELDASIMIGSTRAAGAVAGIKHYRHPISIARKVMELTPHVLLVGEGAERFAQAIGFSPTDQLYDEEVKIYHQNIMKGKKMLDGLKVPQEIEQLAWRYDKYIKEQLASFDYRGWYLKLSEEYHGTVNVIALDTSGELCSGVSTSGLALKFPGRAGDSPVIGAGNYCDRRYGAAACVGTGELAIRLGLARLVVAYLSMGMSPLDAARKGLQELSLLETSGVLQVLTMDARGQCAAVSNSSTLHYYVATSEEPMVVKKETYHVKLINDH